MDLSITIVRHGQTDANTKLLVQTYTDSELNETGIAQAKLLGKYFKDIKFDFAYSSDMKRTHDTARNIISELSHPVDINIDRRLREKEFGESWEGKSIVDLVKERRAKSSDPVKLNEPGAEPYEDFIKRTVSFYNELFKNLEAMKLKGSVNVLILTHGAAMLTFFDFLNSPNEFFETDKGEIDDKEMKKSPSNTSFTQIRVLPLNSKGKRPLKIIKINSVEHIVKENMVSSLNI